MPQWAVLLERQGPFLLFCAPFFLRQWRMVKRRRGTLRPIGGEVCLHRGERSQRAQAQCNAESQFWMRRGQPVGALGTSSDGGGDAAVALAECPVRRPWGRVLCVPTGALRFVPHRSCSRRSAHLAGWLCKVSQQREGHATALEAERQRGASVRKSHVCGHTPSALFWSFSAIAATARSHRNLGC